MTSHQTQPLPSTGRRRGALARIARALPFAVAGVAAAGCQSANDRFLSVTNPDIITPVNVQSADGAVALANGVLSTFRNITGAARAPGCSAACSPTSGRPARRSSRTTRPTSAASSSSTRRSPASSGTSTACARAPTRRSGSLGQYSPGSTALLAEMYVARGFAEMQLALDFCNGIPIAATTGGAAPENGTPRSGAEVFRIAAASLDSAIAIASGTDAQSLLINRAARVARARVALGLNDYAAAARAGRHRADELRLPAHLLPHDEHEHDLGPGPQLAPLQRRATAWRATRATSRCGTRSRSPRRSDPRVPTHDPDVGRDQRAGRPHLCAHDADLGSARRRWTWRTASTRG